MITYEEVVGVRLTGGSLPNDLLNALLRKWEEDISSSSYVRSSRTMYDVSTWPHVETYKAIHDFLSNLLQWGIPGIESLELILVATSGIMELLRSLFYIPTED